MNARDAASMGLLAVLWSGSFVFIRIAVPSIGALPLTAGPSHLPLTAPLALAISASLAATVCYGVAAVYTWHNLDGVSRRSRRACSAVSPAS